MSTRAIFAAPFVLVPLALACSSADSVWNAEDIGRATAQITQVPPQVACIDIKVASARTVDRRFDVMTGESSTLAMNGLPIGAVSFTGAAYSVACASVTASTTATWVSDPVAATLGAGTTTSVQLVLRRNGGASVGVDFQDDDAGATTTCMPGKVMCAGTCANTAADPSNCGACGHMCAPSGPNTASSACVSGQCIIGACNAGFADCNGNRADGCETNLNTTNTSCGACNVACTATQTCTMGVCH